MLPSPAEISYFLEVAQTLNISRAAERLGITQPTLSLSVQRLEHGLGTPLLVRSKSGVRLTRAGVRFASEAKVLLEQWERLRAQALSEESEVRGSVSIGCHPAVAMYSIGSFAGELMREHPDLELNFYHDLSRKITERVISFELDCGIVVNPVQHPDLRIALLCHDEVTLWHGPGAYAADVLICDPNLLQSQALISKSKKWGDETQFRRMINSSSLEVIARLAAVGAGVAILPGRVARRDGHLKLKPLLAKGPTVDDKICLIYRPDSQRSLALKTVVRAIEASFKTK